MIKKLLAEVERIECAVNESIAQGGIEPALEEDKRLPIPKDLWAPFGSQEAYLTYLAARRRVEEDRRELEQLYRD